MLWEAVFLLLVAASTVAGVTEEAAFSKYLDERTDRAR